MLIIAGTLTIEKPATEDVLEACREMMKATHEESGCIDYVFSIDPIDPKIIHVYERWEDEESLNAHFLAPHMAPFRKALASWGVTDRDILKFQVEDVDRMV